MAKESILVIDDEEDILELISYNLTREGFKVTTAASAEAGLKEIAKKMPDLIVLDLMLPGKDGLEFCKELKSRSETSSIAVIMLTAKSDEADMVVGLELGADDYVVKPFSPRVLAARIKSVLRREGGKPDQPKTLERGPLSIVPERHEVLIKGAKADLTHTEFKILHLLAKSPGIVFSRYQIVDLVHGEDYPVTDRSIDVQIVGLRRKLGACGPLVETVRGVGYRFSDA